MFKRLLRWYLLSTRKVALTDATFVGNKLKYSDLRYVASEVNRKNERAPQYSYLVKRMWECKLLQGELLIARTDLLEAAKKLGLDGGISSVIVKTDEPIKYYIGSSYMIKIDTKTHIYRVLRNKFGSSDLFGIYI